MVEKIRVDIRSYVDIDITPELKELLDKRSNTEDDDVYDELSDEIYECIDKELYKKGIRGVEDINDWNIVQMIE